MSGIFAKIITEIIVFVNIFEKIRNFVKNTFSKIWNFMKNTFSKIWNIVKNTFSKRCHVLVVLAVPSSLSCPGYLSGQLVQSKMSHCPVPVVRSQMSSLRCPVLTQLSCPGCPVPLVLFQLPCPGNLVHSSPDATAISRQSCSLCPFQAHLSRLTCPDYLFPAIMSGCSFRVVLAQMSFQNCPGCPIPLVLS